MRFLIRYKSFQLGKPIIISQGFDSFDEAWKFFCTMQREGKSPSIYALLNDIEYEP